MNKLPIGQSQFVRVGDIALHVRVDDGPVREGAGSNEERPSFAYINSLGSDMRIWDGVVRSLPGRHVRHDLRGHGLSDAPPGPYSISALAGDLRECLKACGADRVVLVGISVGGLIALRTALDSPELVHALVICDSAAKIGSEEAWNQRIAKVEAGELPDVARTVVPGWFSAGFADRDPATFSGYLNMVGRTIPGGYAATCAALRDEDLRDRLGEIRVPTLVLCGSEDPSTTPQMCQELADALPDGRYREIANTGHLPCAERPDVVAAVFRGFAEEVDGG